MWFEEKQSAIIHSERSDVSDATYLKMHEVTLPCFNASRYTPRSLSIPELQHPMQSTYIALFVKELLIRLEYLLFVLMVNKLSLSISIIIITSPARDSGGAEYCN